MHITTALLDAIPDPAVMLDMRGAVRIANREAVRMLGPVIPGRPVSFFLRAPEVLEAVARVAESGDSTSVRYYERVPIDRWLEAHVAMVAADAPDAGILVVLHDLTQAQRLERMRADFVAHASHELRTPLASLSGFIETLQGPARDDAAARERFLAIMQAQAQRMSRLIDDLLSLSRIELNAHLMPSGRQDLGEAVGHVVDGLRPLAASQEVEIALARPAEPLVVRGDRDELVRLFENLVENAIKYAGSGKRIEVSLGSAGQQAVVAVRDFGPGIAPEHLPRLTERFYRVDVAESRGKGGTGLGLAIVKHIVNRHRGTLAIESEPGQGATFTVRIDLA